MHGLQLYGKLYHKDAGWLGLKGFHSLVDGGQWTVLKQMFKKAKDQVHSSKC
jgi:hypothetical protein